MDVLVTQLGVDTKANDDALDAQLRTELNAMTSRLGDVFRAKNAKVQEAFGKLESATMAALEGGSDCSFYYGYPTRLPALRSHRHRARPA